MELQHINAKIFVDGQMPVDLEQFIVTFHRWIREKATDELLIDVADYRHVPDGPSVMLIGHEADYGMDNTDGRYGMIYNRKAPLQGTNVDRLRQALGSAAKACQRLEEEFTGDGPLRFSRSEFELIVNDRALAPNTAETLAACRPEVEEFLGQVLGHREFSLEHDASDTRRRFSITVKTTRPFDLAALK